MPKDLVSSEDKVFASEVAYSGCILIWSKGKREQTVSLYGH